MAVSIQVFDPHTQLANTINVTVESSLIQGDADAELDFYLRITTDARRGPTGADVIPTEVTRSLADLALGTRQFKVNTADPYDDITEQVEDYVLKMVEGVGVGEHMYFGTGT